jgi:hypothetical protein
LPANPPQSSACIGIGLKDMSVRFAAEVDDELKDPLAMYIELPGMAPIEGDPAVQMKFSLKDAVAGLVETLGAEPGGERNLALVRDALLKVAGNVDRQLRSHRLPPRDRR